MTRVDEIVSALKSKPEPMFLYGLVVMAQRDYDGLMRDLIEADMRMQIEQENKEGSNGRRERF